MEQLVQRVARIIREVADPDFAAELVVAALRGEAMAEQDAQRARWRAQKQSQRAAAAVPSAVRRTVRADVRRTVQPVASGSSPDQGSKNQEDPEGSRSDEAKRADPVRMSFPIVGTGAKEWDLRESFLLECQQGYPSLDVAAAFRAARVWIVANPAKRKTASGMPKFLAGWLSRAQNSARGSPTPNGKRDVRTGWAPPPEGYEYPEGEQKL